MTYVFQSLAIWNSSPCNQTTLLFKNLIMSWMGDCKSKSASKLSSSQRQAGGAPQADLSSFSSSIPTTELEQEDALTIATCSEIFAKLQVFCNYNRYLSDNKRKLGSISG